MRNDYKNILRGYYFFFFLRMAKLGAARIDTISRRERSFI